MSTTYHDGELRVQTRAGVRETASRNARTISNSIPRGALLFIQQQVMVVLGSVDEHGQPWCSVVFGTPGFMQTPDVQTLEFNTQLMGMSTIDPIWRNIATHSETGVLLIELSTRRRLRLNGRLLKTAEHRYTLQFEQVYPNCPKYIQRRAVLRIQPRPSPIQQQHEHGTILAVAQRNWIAQADTFFVASAQRDGHGHYHVDASHRGGRPGFVEIINDHRLRIPDYIGNSMFNTLGNFDAYPFAGLVFIDFEQQQLLQLTGQVSVLWDQDTPVDTTGGTRRYWEFDVAHWQVVPVPWEIAWEFVDYSPHIP